MKYNIEIQLVNNGELKRSTIWFLTLGICYKKNHKMINRFQDRTHCHPAQVRTYVGNAVNSTGAYKLCRHTTYSPAADNNSVCLRYNNNKLASLPVFYILLVCLIITYDISMKRDFYRRWKLQLQYVNFANLNA